MATWTIKVGGVDVSADVPYQSVNLKTSGYEGTGVLSFSLKPGSTATCNSEQAVELLVDAATQYRGFVREVERTVLPKIGMSRAIVCQDLTTQLAPDVIENTGSRSAGESDKTRIEALLTAWGTRSITTGTTVQTIMSYMPAADYTGMNLYDAITEICAVSGARFYVAMDSKLHYFVTESSAAPFNLSDNESPPTTRGYGQITVPESTTELFNRVVVFGPPGRAARVRSSTASITQYSVTRTAAIRDARWDEDYLQDAAGDGFLADHAFAKSSAKCTVYYPGLVAGQQIQVTNAALGWSAKSMRIQEVSTKIVSATDAVFEVTLGDAPVDLGTIIGGGSALAKQALAASDFAMGLAAEASSAVTVVGSLPNLPNASYPQGKLVMLTTDKKLYRNTDDPGSHPTNSTWVRAVSGAAVADGGDILANTITAGAISAGAVGADAIAANAITTAKLSVAGAVGPAGIDNPGFETGAATFWTEVDANSNGVFSVEAVATASNKIGTGLYQGVITKTANTGSDTVAARSNSYLPTKPGEYVSVSALMQLVYAGASKMQVHVIWYTSALASISSTTKEWTGATGIAAGRYTNVFGPAPASTAFVRCQIVNNTTWTSGTAYLVFDDVRMQVGDSAIATAGGNVQINADGVTITGGKLTVKNGNDVVIIDGTSDMFRIVATGTSVFPTLTGTGWDYDNLDVYTGSFLGGALMSWMDDSGQLIPIPYFQSFGPNWPDQGATFKMHWLITAIWYDITPDPNYIRLYIDFMCSDTNGGGGEDLRYYVLYQAAI